MLVDSTVKPFKQLAEDTFAEFLSRVGDDFEEFDHSDECLMLTAVVADHNQGEKLARKLKYAARALAKECKERGFVALGPLPLPQCIEQCEAMYSGNINMRIVKAWDINRSEIVIRLDVLGSIVLPEVTAEPYKP